MSRTIGFSRDVVLDRAIGVFWEKGETTTSVQDLVIAMGINRSSLYGYFGSKEDLFLAALDRYRDTVVTHALSGLEATNSGIDEIVDYLTLISSAPADTLPGRFGCLMANTMSDLHCESSDVTSSNAARAKVRAHFDRLVRAFDGALRRGIAGGELEPTADVRSLSASLAVTVQGMSACARLGSPEILRTTASVAISALPIRKRTTSESKGKK